MRVASGRVIAVVSSLNDAERPERAAVMVPFPEGDGTFEVDPATENMLLEAIAQCERGETISLEQVIEELRGRE